MLKFKSWGTSTVTKLNLSSQDEGLSKSCRSIRRKEGMSNNAISRFVTSLDTDGDCMSQSFGILLKRTGKSKLKIFVTSHRCSLTCTQYLVGSSLYAFITAQCVAQIHCWFFQYTYNYVTCSCHNRTLWQLDRQFVYQSLVRLYFKMYIMHCLCEHNQPPLLAISTHMKLSNLHLSQ